MGVGRGWWAGEERRRRRPACGLYVRLWGRDIYATCRDKNATRVACWMAWRARSSLGRAANAWVAALSGSLRILLLLVVAVNRFRTWSAGGAIYHIDNGCIFFARILGEAVRGWQVFRPRVAPVGRTGSVWQEPALAGTHLTWGYAQEVRGRTTGALFANLGDLKNLPSQYNLPSNPDSRPLAPPFRALPGTPSGKALAIGGSVGLASVRHVATNARNVSRIDWLCALNWADIGRFVVYTDLHATCRDKNATRVASMSHCARQYHMEAAWT